MRIERFHGVCIGIERKYVALESSSLNVTVHLVRLPDLLVYLITA